MDHKRRDSQRFNPGQKSFRRDPSQATRGFAGLDPAKMGLGGADWLTPSSPLTEQPTESAWPESDAEAERVLSARTVLEGLKVVCICKGIKKSVFWKVLDAGARSKEEINRLTGSGSGGCHGRRCGPCIMDMLRELLP
jgi:bacterioferritin-associated ferredoxin